MLLHDQLIRHLSLMEHKDPETGEKPEPLGESSRPRDSEGTEVQCVPKTVNWNPGDPTDGRQKYECESAYSRGCRVQIFVEALYLTVLMVVAAYLIIWYVAGDSMLFFYFDASAGQLSKPVRDLLAFPIAGLIGGTMFGLKWQYRVSARGWWHKDRRVWRICSPWLSAALAMMVGIAIDGGLLGLSFSHNAANPTSTLLSVGFVTGYFADSALAKLQDIASVVFGTSQREQNSQQK